MQAGTYTLAASLGRHTFSPLPAVAVSPRLFPVGPTPNVAQGITFFFARRDTCYFLTISYPPPPVHRTSMNGPELETLGGACVNTCGCKNLAIGHSKQPRTIAYGGNEDSRFVPLSRMMEMAASLNLPPKGARNWTMEGFLWRDLDPTLGKVRVIVWDRVSSDWTAVGVS